MAAWAGVLCLEVNQPQRDTNHSPPSTAENKNDVDISPLQHSHYFLMLNELRIGTLLIYLSQDGWSLNSGPSVLEATTATHRYKLVLEYRKKCLTPQCF
jgi:hypothetical protein